MIEEKRKIWGWCLKHSSVRDPLDLSPWNYNKLNRYNTTKDFSLTHKHFWEICASEHLKVGRSGEQGKRKGKRAETGAVEAAWSSLQYWGRGEESGCGVLCSPERSWLSDQHILRQNPGIRAEARAETEYRGATAVCSSNCHCQAKSWAMEPDFPLPPSLSSPPCIIPELAASVGL